MKVILINGYGFNQDYYVYMNQNIISVYKGDFVTIPESFFVEIAMYGGIIAFVLGVLLWKELFDLAKKLQSHNTGRILFWLLLGLLIGNLFSGASVISDLLYSQLLIACGILLRYEIVEQKYNNDIRKLINNSFKLESW